MTGRRITQGSLALTAALALACTGPEAADRSTATVRIDSAGVEVITYASGAFEDTLPPGPLLTIGREGELDYEFFRIATVVPLGSGNVVVVNQGTHELRFFDAQGRYLRTAGRRGDGPAEFGFLTTAWLLQGDTIAAHDPNRRRVVYFDSAGTFVRGASFADDLNTESRTTGVPCFAPGLAGLLADGARVTRGYGCMMFEGSDGIRSTEESLEIVRPDETVSLGVFESGQFWERASADFPNNYTLAPLRGSLRRAVGHDRIFISRGRDFEIEVYDGQGRLVQLLREDMVPPPLTDAVRDAYLEASAAAGFPHPEDVPFPERLGSYSTLLLSHEGDLWAQRVDAADGGDQRWVVFSSDGSGVRRVVVPDIEVEAVRGGRMYGHQTDSLGIQTVVVLGVGR